MKRILNVLGLTFVFRCSGKNKCMVELLRDKQPDPDVTRLCHYLPEGKITVKYLCYNASSGKRLSVTPVGLSPFTTVRLYRFYYNSIDEKDKEPNRIIWYQHLSCWLLGTDDMNICWCYKHIIPWSRADACAVHYFLPPLIYCCLCLVVCPKQIVFNTILLHYACPWTCPEQHMHETSFPWCRLAVCKMTKQYKHEPIYILITGEFGIYYANFWQEC